jgi:hypothetical protein
MSDLEKFLRPKPFPSCCGKCIHLDNDYDEYQDKTYWYCGEGIWFPTKKQTCKKQKLRKDL